MCIHFPNEKEMAEMIKKEYHRMRMINVVDFEKENEQISV